MNLKSNYKIISRSGYVRFFIIFAIGFFSQLSSWGIEKNTDVQIVSSKAQFISFLPFELGERLKSNSELYGLVLNTRYCNELTSQHYEKFSSYVYDCNGAFDGAFNKPLLNKSEYTEVYNSNGRYYSRKLGTVYEVRAVIKAAALEAMSFKGVGLHAHNVDFTESSQQKYWGELVGSNDARGGFLSKATIEKIKKEVTLKNGEKAYVFDFILAQIHLISGNSKPNYSGMTIRPNALYTENGNDYIRWDQVEFDYYLGRDFDRTSELLSIDSHK